MRTSTTDPMTGNDVQDTENAPFVIEGTGDNRLKIYFESEHSKLEYLQFSVNEPDGSITQAYNATKDNEIAGTIN